MVADPTPPADRDDAATRGAAAGARYVIWREASELVVLDRDRGEVERRPAAAGPLAPLAAAAAALSVKTMLRLPPLPAVSNGAPDDTSRLASRAPSNDPAQGVELRFAASTGARVEYGLDGNVALRFGASMALRPWRRRDWRFAVIGDAGAPATVDQAGFHGQWWNWAALIGASWDHALGAWELGPWLAVGIEHSSLRGTESAMTRSEEAIEPAVRGGVAIRYRTGSVWLGAQLALEGLATTTTYTRASAPLLKCSRSLRSAPSCRWWSGPTSHPDLLRLFGRGLPLEGTVGMAVRPSNPREHDVALAQRAASGDRGAQRELFQAQKHGVHHALFRILGSNRELEDLLQDAFIAIFRALPAFRGDSTLGRWCQTIATRTAYGAIAKRRPATLELVDDLVADHAPDAQRVMRAREAVRRLYGALDRIEAKQRIAFAFAVIDGRTLAEVAELTESSLLAVKTRVWRARRELMRRAAKDELLASYLTDLGGES